MQPLCTHFCADWSDSEVDRRAVSHITQYTTQLSHGARHRNACYRTLDQGSVNYDKQVKSSLGLYMAQELGMVSTFLKYCKTKKQQRRRICYRDHMCPPPNLK